MGIQIIDPEERFPLEIEGAILHLRRIGSQDLMAIERRLKDAEDSAELNDEILDFVILDWEGVTSPLGDSEVPCTRQNKIRLPAPIKLKILSAIQMPRAAAGVGQGVGRKDM